MVNHPNRSSKITEGQSPNHSKPSAYKFVRYYGGGTRRNAWFQEGDGTLELFHGTKTGHAGWGLKFRGLIWEFVSGA